MAKITEIEKGRFVAVLSQQELNTISLLLGAYEGDDYIREIGEDFEEYPKELDNANINYVTGVNSDNLFNTFKKHRTVLEDREGR